MTDIHLFHTSNIITNYFSTIHRVSEQSSIFQINKMKVFVYMTAKFWNEVACHQHCTFAVSDSMCICLHQKPSWYCLVSNLACSSSSCLLASH